MSASARRKIQRGTSRPAGRGGASNNHRTTLTGLSGLISRSGYARGLPASKQIRACRATLKIVDPDFGQWSIKAW